MITTQTYLTFPGTCEEAFQFYEKVLGGKIIAMMKPVGTPAEAMMKDRLDQIMHARMTVGPTIIMGSDAPPSYYTRPGGFSVNITLDDPTEADRIYAALSEGGQQTMAIQETFWAIRFGTLVDRFGIPWMVNCEKPMPA